MTNHITQNPTENIITTIADDLRQSLADNHHDTSINTLIQQVRMLAKLHQAMIDEAKPHTEQGRHDMNRLSMALRAQNQFCRSLMVLDHLEQRDLERTNLSNELKNPFL